MPTQGQQGGQNFKNVRSFNHRMCEKFNHGGAIVVGSHPGLDLMKFITFL